MGINLWSNFSWYSFVYYDDNHSISPEEFERVNDMVVLSKPFNLRTLFMERQYITVAFNSTCDM